MNAISATCIGILLIAILIMSFIIGKLSRQSKQKIELDIKTKEKNKEIQLRNEQLTQEALELSKTILQKQEEIMSFQKQQEQEKEQFDLALSSYSDILQTKYKQVETYFDYQLDLIELEYDSKLAELETIKATRAAMIEANRREELVKANPELFTLPLSPADRTDIQTLENIKGQLNNPRILSMLIWSTFFQKPMTTLCNNILGTKIVCGIYKITNLKTNMCYIGQAVDMATRWKTHCKCGLGIDTPQSNKLYKAMQEDGVWNFSWELLEECPQSQLNEKEAEYIEIYQSKDYGYNTQAGRRT